MTNKWIASTIFGLALLADFAGGEMAAGICRLEESSTYALAVGPVVALGYRFFSKKFRRTEN